MRASPADCTSWALAHLPPGAYSTQEICRTPFSLVLQLSGAGGVFYLKQLPPELFREAAVTAALAAYAPGAVPRVMAVDAGLGCFLTADHGAQLRQLVKAGGATQLPARAMQVYAGIQQAALPHVQELLALGVPDWRPRRLPLLFEELLAGNDFKSLGFPARQHTALLQYAGAMAAQCERLAALGIPATIEHADFQDKNVLAEDGRLSVIDWGEAVIAHPFFSLRRFLVSVSIHHKLEGRDIKAAYLACWPDDPQVCEQAYALVEELSAAYAALAYAQLAKASGSAGQGYWQRSIAPLLQDILNRERS